MSLEVEAVDAGYGTLQVLFGVQLAVQPGEVVALLGTNGSGKSTLLRVVAGLCHPTSGAVRLGGQDITRIRAEDRVALGLVQVVGGRGVFADLTVDENLRLGAYPLRSDRALVARRTAEVLELFPELGHRGSQRAGRLSGGERQMLALAKALLLSPKVLCIDELSLGLAPTVVARLLEVIDGLKRSGTTMVVVEQSLNVAAALAGRAIFLEKGHVRFEGPTADLNEEGDIARAVFFGGAVP